MARPSSSSAAGSSSAGKDGAAGKDGKTPAQLRAEEAERRRRPLLAKSSVCRLLAELVRSYATVAKIVTEYTYTAGPDSEVTEVGTRRHRVCVRTRQDRILRSLWWVPGATEYAYVHGRTGF